jgi:hypothetical protein
MYKQLSACRLSLDNFEGRPAGGGGKVLICLLLKVPKCEIFDRLDFHDFYSIKPFWVGDFGAKI